MGGPGSGRRPGGGRAGKNFNRVSKGYINYRAMRTSGNVSFNTRAERRSFAGISKNIKGFRNYRKGTRA